jgi:hypothetical protein
MSNPARLPPKIKAIIENNGDPNSNVSSRHDLQALIRRYSANSDISTRI